MTGVQTCALPICGCTVAKVSNVRIAPLDTTSLVVSLTSKDVQGKVRREVNIFSNDTSQSKVTVVFTANIISFIQVLPRYIAFNKVSLDSKTGRTVQLTNTTNDTIRILSCKAPEHQLRLSLSTKTLPPNGIADLRVTLSAKKVGNILGQIVLTTTSAVKPQVTISYVGDVVQ